MRNKTYGVLICGTAVTAVGLVHGARDVTSPARRPDADIRAEVLAATPVGSPRAAVEAFVGSRPRQVGDPAATHIAAEYGSYTTAGSLPWRVDVLVTWRLHQGVVTDVEVSRDVVAP